MYFILSVVPYYVQCGEYFSICFVTFTDCYYIYFPFYRSFADILSLEERVEKRLSPGHIVVFVVDI
jgi:hypothetical protein